MMQDIYSIEAQVTTEEHKNTLVDSLEQRVSVALSIRSTLIHGGYAIWFESNDIEEVEDCQNVFKDLEIRYSIQHIPYNTHAS